MDKTVIQIIFRIMLDADGGCANCAYSLIHQLVLEYPSFKSEVLEFLKHESKTGYPADSVYSGFNDGFLLDD